MQISLKQSAEHSVTLTETSKQTIRKIVQYVEEPLKTAMLQILTGWPRLQPERCLAYNTGGGVHPSEGPTYSQEHPVNLEGEHWFH